MLRAAPAPAPAPAWAPARRHKGGCGGGLPSPPPPRSPPPPGGAPAARSPRPRIGRVRPFARGHTDAAGVGRRRVVLPASVRGTLAHQAQIIWVYLDHVVDDAVANNGVSHAFGRSDSSRNWPAVVWNA